MGMVPGGHTGWVYRVGNTGVPVLPSTLLEEGPADSEAGPEASRREAGVVVCRSRTPEAPGPPTPDPLGPPGPAPLSWAFSPGKPASGPIRARLRSKYKNVSQNDEVSPKSVEKASISPCFQNGLRISPLEILRFPYIAAFSHKELMVPF